MRVNPRFALACLFAGIAAAILFLLSAFRWNREETGRVVARDVTVVGQERPILRLESMERPRSWRSVPVPDAPFEAARPGDHVYRETRTLPEVEIRCIRYRLVRDGRVLATWTEGTLSFGLAATGVSLLAGLVAAFFVAGLARVLEPSPK